MLSHRYLMLCAAGLLTCAGCNKLQADAREALLTGNGRGQYWDQVCSNNGLDRYNMDISPGRSYNDELRGLPTSTLLFSANNKLMYYKNLDSLRIMDMNIVAGDVVYNPATYKLMGNEIKLIGDTCEILLLSKEIMVLKRIGRGGFIRVYMPSKWQHKVAVKENL